MASPRLPVLWFCGAPGTGKSTVAWRVLLDLEREGVRAGYVDIDQLGVVYPPPDGDPDRNALKTVNLEAVISNYAGAGARVLVVSGVTDPEQVQHFSGANDRFEVTFCQLTTEEPALRERLAARGWSTADGDWAVEVRGRRLINLAPTHTHRPLVSLAVPRGDVTVVCGPRAVGKSSVSWAMFTQRTATGRRTCYLDLDQISVLRGGGVTDPDRGSLRNANLAALWRTAAANGATALIASGTITGDDDVSGLRDAVRPAELHIIRLSAEPAAIWDRIRWRHAGSPARLIGDDLDGASPDHQRRVLRDALAQEHRLSRTRLPDQVIDTTAMSLDEVVHRVTTPLDSEVPGRAFDRGL